MAEAADISGDSEESEAGKHLPCLTSFMPHFLHGFIWFPNVSHVNVDAG